MQITIPYNTAKTICKSDDKANDILKKNAGWKFRDFLEGTDEDKDGNLITIDLSTLNKTELKTLASSFAENEVKAKTVTTINLWIKNVSNPSKAIVTSLPMLEKMLISTLKENSKRWIGMQNVDGNIALYAVSRIKSYNRNRDDEATTVMDLEYITIDNKSSSYLSDDKDISKKKSKKSINFYKWDLGVIDNESIYESLDEDDEEDEERKPKQKRTKGGNTLDQILHGRGLFLIGEEEIESHYTDSKNAHEIQRKIGRVFTSNTKGYVMPDTKKGYATWRDLNTDENTLSKLVVDNIKSSDISYSDKSEQFGTFEIPEHPYVLTYNISQFNYAAVHVSSLTEYQYNDKIIDKLVISPKKKKVLSSLISNENNFNDIISGKSGGIIILSTGIPGVGKTLTAEVYGELMKKPLYSIQSSQLGISVNEIEDNLNKVLYRADKWGAILLIDEADSYIYKRGNDIVQNCIVGTFLRLLEYYNGILFLTSNRPDIVDDAIMSRVTLHVKYGPPTEEEFTQLWNVLSEGMGLKLDKGLIEQFLAKYSIITGRDIRNLLKDVKKCYAGSKTVKFEMIEELEEFLPFINNKK